MPASRRRRLLAALGIGFGAGVVAWLLSGTAVVDRFETITYDLRLRATAPPAPADSPIVIVEINEASVQALADAFGRWPWPRIAHAAAIDFLASAGAKVIAYDVLFTEHDSRGAFELAGQRISGGISDDALVNSVRQAGNVILLANAVDEGLADEKARQEQCNAQPLLGTTYAPGPGFQVRPCLKLPFPELAAAAAGVGHNFSVVDAGLSRRRLDPFIVHDGLAIPALGLAAALFAERLPPEAVHLEPGTTTLDIGPVRWPLERDRAIVASGGEDAGSGAAGRSGAAEGNAAGEARGAGDAPGTGGSPGTVDAATALRGLLWFRQPVAGPDGVAGTFPSYPFFDVLLSGDQVATGQTPVIDPAVFKDKIVFVGTTAAGLFDIVQTPFDLGGIGGVHLHATLADNVLTGHVMARAPRSLETTITIVAGVGIGLVATLVPVAWGTPIALGLMGALIWALTAAVGRGLWVGLVPPAGAAALALFGGVAWQYFIEGRAKREVRRLFGRFVSKDVIAQLEADPTRAQLGGRRREMSVLFSDVRGFTAASERRPPEDVVLQLNEYFSAMVDVLFRHHGTLDKFVGDMVMGLFGAPLDDGRHADHAVACAVAMTVELERLNDRWETEGRPRMDIGIGINSGEMIAGNIGSEAIMSYTVIGDAVNLASRLESLNKEHGTRILISEATRS
ncbi:MAG: adenylate/guanylate cyclase domain-containing protein, partial [Vicinamibacterales bacterium]